MGAPKSVSARDLSIPDSSPPAKKQENWLFCCSRGAPKFQQSGRLMKKPAAQKLQRSAGAARSAPRVIDFSKADPSKWSFPVTEYDGKFSFFSEPVKEEVTGQISEGLEKLKKDPAAYEGYLYQSNMKDWPADQQKYTLIKRTG